MNDLDKENEIKNIVIDGYKNILKRDPDPDGLANYINEIKNGLSIERFYDILRSSDEYKERFNPSAITPVQEVVYAKTEMYTQNISPNIQSRDIVLTYCMIGFNKLHEIKPYIETVLPYVDRFIYIDGSYDDISTDGTIQYLYSLNFHNNNKIEIYAHKWQDNFSEQRNYYLKHFAERQKDGWIISSDTDEHFPIETLSKLKDEIKVTESKKYNGIRIKAHDIITDDENPDEIISEKTSNFYKPLLFKYHPNIIYEGEVHETLKGFISWKLSDLIYNHTRSQRKIYERAVVNFWIWSNSLKEFKEFRSLCTKNNILKFKDFFQLYKNGILPEEIEKWIYDHMNYKENSQDLDALEVKDTAKFYFEILHCDKKIKYEEEVKKI